MANIVFKKLLLTMLFVMVPVLSWANNYTYIEKMLDRYNSQNDGYKYFTRELVIDDVHTNGYQVFDAHRVLY